MKRKDWDKNSINKIKDIEEINIAIKKIKEIENDISYEDLRNLFFELFNFFSIPFIYFEKQFLEVLKVYRCRPYDKKFDIANPDTFSAPPWDKDIGFGRANWKKRNVFYGSDTAITALKEAKEQYKEGSEFYLAKWRFDYSKFTTIDKIQVYSLVIGNLSPENPWSKVLPESESLKINLEKEIGEKQTEKIIYLVKKISELFVELDKTKYPVTAFIADQSIYFDFHHNIQSQIQFPILLYPSIENNTKNCNFAIHPFFVKQYMKLEKVFHIKLDELNSNSLKYNLIKIGFCNDNNIIEWNELLPLDINKSTCQIESIDYYLLGEKISVKNEDVLILRKNNQEITYREIVQDFINELDCSELYKLDDFIEAEGKVLGKKVNFSSIPLKDTCATINDIEYSNLTMDLEFLQPFEYNSIT